MALDFSMKQGMGPIVFVFLLLLKFPENRGYPKMTSC